MFPACESLAEILIKYDHLNESYWAILSDGAVDNAVQGGSNSSRFASVNRILKCNIPNGGNCF